MQFISTQEAEDRAQAGGRSVCPYAAGRLAGKQAYVVALQPSNTLAVISGLGKDAVGGWLRTPCSGVTVPMLLVASKSS